MANDEAPQTYEIAGAPLRCPHCEHDRFRAEERVIAKPRFFFTDNFYQPRAVLGVRAGPCVDRSLLFLVDHYAVDVVVQAGSRGLWSVHGQVSCDDAGTPVIGARVRLGRAAVAVETDEYGEFAVSSLHTDELNLLRIETEAAELVCCIPASPEPVAR